MHEEIQVALNFLISFLYNKLPRRRVNQFGEELELILKKRFIDHWYPLEPSKGSAYRCIHCNPQLDSSLFREAAQKSGLNLQDVQQNFPNELSIWIDPGEVSYRINEKGPVNILFSLNKQRLSSSLNNNNGESTTTTTPTIINGLNPEAQCFQPESKHFIINNDISRANSFSNSSSSSNGQTFSQCHSSLTSPLSSSQQQSHSGSDLLNTVMNNLAIVNQNRHNGQSQQILNNQQQQKMRQLMQWNNNNNNEIKSAFDRDQQQQQCMLGLFEQQQQPQMQRNSFDVFPPNSSNMNWNQTNQSNGGIQRSISMISDHGNDYNNGVGGNNLLLETFMPDKLLREIFEIGNNDDDQDHNHDDSNDNLLMILYFHNF
ncbi:transducer of ERBB2 [Dermatophagoides pteronyssinus]|uniref:Transducer of ERBB2 n=1 Tax=Dermatophagoides pteronyssinus TaxID=6956 RepID=A0ABQ8IW38_DERPT|nr:transducer of ERBB2 [Dermatophagoides pteronyssinus]